MKRLLYIAAAALLVLFVVARIFAQQPAPPPQAAPPAQPAASSPLDALAFMQGNWAGKQDFNNPNGPAMAGDATDRIEIGIAGKYLCELLSTTMPNRKPTDTRHFISYDKASGKYTAWWFNDTSTHPTEFTGDLTGSKLVLTSKSAGPGPVLRATYESPAKNTLTFLLEMQQGDNWTKLFVTTYTKPDATVP
jgi:hypothetical protein